MERKQAVRVKNTLSSNSKVISGVPQGSVLEPLLFLVFIGDLGKNLDPEVANILKYVDNSKILGFVKTVEDVNKLQIQLDDIYKWADANNMEQTKISNFNDWFK